MAARKPLVINAGRIQQLQAGDDLDVPLIVTSTSASILLSATNQVVLVNASGADRTMTLPAAAANSGRTYWIKKTDSSNNKVIIDPNGAELIDGFSTYEILNQYDAVMIVCDGTGWNVL